MRFIKKQYTIKELCEIFNRTKPTIARAIKEFNIKFHTEPAIGGQEKIVVLREDITDEFVEKLNLEKIVVPPIDENENVCISISSMSDEEYKKNMTKFVYGMVNFGGYEYNKIDWNVFRKSLKLEIVKIGGITEFFSKFNYEQREVRRFIEEKINKLSKKTFRELVSFMERKDGI